MYIYNYIWWSGCFSLALSLAELFEKAMEGGRERERCIDKIIYIYVNMCICKYVNIYIYIYITLNNYIHIHVNIYICKFMNIYIFTPQLFMD